MKQRIAFIGVGLIGGSLALAVRQAGLYDEICGFDSDLDNLQLALELGVIDDAMSSIHEILESAQLVVIATPVGVIKPVLQAIKPYWNSDCVYTDVGSTKQSVIHDLQDVFGELPANFVPGHPVAGTEQSGSGAAFAELYRNKHVILTPGQSTSESAVQRVRELWGQGAGAIVNEMPADHHDQILAATSHLPHIAAFALVNLLSKNNDDLDYSRFTAGGFKDFTRIASSDSEMWSDICLANREYLLPLLKDYQRELDHLLSCLKQGDKQQLMSRFSNARKTRQHLVGGNIDQSRNTTVETT
ncbi:MAG: prephenate dehydrogenase/arogenate dehydrogenase family protein [Gammaproteobacteria bacterium]|nr:prephenate dehydrogenase/arogenate dehydrogenase family protein [Gammaproteobacteria bacterium]